MAGHEPRPFAEVRTLMLGRARERRNPFTHTVYEEVAGAIGRLISVDRDAWAEAIGSLAVPYAERAARAEQRGDAATALENHLRAYDYYHVARYPAPNSPGKLRAYRRSQEHLLAAARYFDPPMNRVEMPFAGRPGEGSVAVGYLRKPSGVERPPVAVIWGGIDAFKEERAERQSGDYLAIGMAALAIDMPGVGDAPLVGSEDAERLWDAVLDWIGSQPDLDAERVALLGGSTGGYWATKLAHTHRERVRAVVNHGGPAHYAFTEAWIAKAQRGEYPFELAETLASAFGRATYEEWVEYCPRLSLLHQGILDQPCAPLLCINGVNDTVFPIQDMYLLLEHGDPKAARFTQGGHMGGSREAREILRHWLQRQLA